MEHLQEYPYHAHDIQGEGCSRRRHNLADHSDSKRWRVD